MEIARALYPVDFGARRTFHITCIFERTKLISVGENSIKTHVINRRNNKNKFNLAEKGSCSELQAVLKLKNQRNFVDWKKLSIVNLRINKDNNFCMSRPCSFCQSMLKYFNCRNVYFTNELGKFQKYE